MHTRQMLATGLYLQVNVSHLIYTRKKIHPHFENYENSTDRLGTE